MMNFSATMSHTESTKRAPLIKHDISHIPTKIAVLCKRARKFVTGLGPWGGLRTLGAAFVGVHEISVLMPTVRYPIVIRPRTSDRFVFEQIFLDGDYKLEVDLSPRFIVDAGANVGFASIYFANRYPGATIVAIEPEAANFAALERNVRMYSKIVPVRAALWSSCKPLWVNGRGDSWSCSVADVTENASESVWGITIPELLHQQRQTSVDILKMDIEGSEREVFSAECRPWLPRTKALIVELHDELQPGCSVALNDAICGLDFQRLHQGENLILINQGIWRFPWITWHVSARPLGFLYPFERGRETAIFH
jgi:FkbM family methyltransferase